MSQLTEKMRKQIAAAVAEIDMEQIKITRRMTTDQRDQIALSMIKDAEEVGAYRLSLSEQELREKEALFIIPELTLIRLDIILLLEIKKVTWARISKYNNMLS